MTSHTMFRYLHHLNFRTIQNEMKPRIYWIALYYSVLNVTSFSNTLRTVALSYFTNNYSYLP